MSDQEQSWPKVAVIIPTLNVEGFIRGCLESILANEYPKDKIDIIIVDNGSNDQTKAIAREYTDQVHTYEGVTISTLRNKGTTHSDASVFAFLDSDCLADPNWLQAGVETLQAYHCIAGSLYDFPEDAEWIESDWFVLRDEGTIETTHTGAGNLFITRALFEEVGGFNEALITGEDTEFCARVQKKAKVISNDKIRAVHLGNPKTLYQFFRREMWYGLGAFGSFRVHWLDKPLLGTLAFVLLSLAQVIGVIALGFGASSCLLILSSLGILALLALSVWYRRRFLKSPGHALRLLLLFYLYYLGRSVALFFILKKKELYHNIKS